MTQLHTFYSSFNHFVQCSKRHTQYTSEEEKFEFILDVAKGKMKFEQIKAWIQTNLIKNVL